MLNYDVFHRFLVEKASYEGFFEMPKILTSNNIPNKIISFSKAVEKNTNDYDAWVGFYEQDIKFERLWNNPKRYLMKLKKFRGIISPDFSLYRNMPLVMQMWNTYRGRALASWFYENGIEVIPNVRWNDERTYLFAFDGIEKHNTVSVGTHGCIKKKEDKVFFKKGLTALVDKLSPKRIVVYGSAPDSIFGQCKEKGIEIIPFESEFSKSRRQVNV